MTSKRKLFTPAHFKAIDDGEPEGTFEAVISVFDNIDAHGDIIRKGTFVDAIKKMKSSKTPWPVVFSHQSWDLDSIMGITLAAEEIKGTDSRIPASAPPELKAGGGLWIKGRMTDLEEPFTAKVWARMKDGRIVQWSYAYDLLDGGVIDIDGKSFYEFRRADVLEVGPTLLGANSATRTLALKARAKGRPNLAKAIDLVSELSALEVELGDDVSTEQIDAALGALENLATSIETADVVDLTGADDDEATADLREMVAEVVTEVLARRRSTATPGGATTVTVDNEGKARGKSTEDRTGGKADEDCNAEDPTTSPYRLLADIEALGLEAEVEL